MKTRNKRYTFRWPQIVGFFLLLLSAYSLVSILTFQTADYSFFVSSPNNPVDNKGGIVGAHIAFFMRFWFGLSAYLLPALFLLWAGCFFSLQIPRERFAKGVGLLLLLFGSSTIFALTWSGEERFDAGGAVGFYFANKLIRYCGVTGGYLISIFCVLIALTVSTDFVLSPWIRGVFTRITQTILQFIAFTANSIESILDRVNSTTERIKPKKQERPKPTAAPKPGINVEEHTYIPPKVKTYQPNTHDTDEGLIGKSNRPSLKQGKKETSIVDSAEKQKLRIIQKSREPEKIPPEEKVEPATALLTNGRSSAGDTAYEFPPIDMLELPKKAVASTQILQENSRLLESTLRDFGIEVRVTEIEQGPVITRYEVLPAAGVKVQSILTRQDDLALALRAKSIRIQAPIPGKAAVGIEIPNPDAHTVCLRDLITSPQVRSKRAKLPLFLGKDTSGKPIIADLSDLPHILIAGTTGSGKTVCLNAIIAGFLYFLSPDDLKFIMVDPKMVELSIYNSLPHLLAPVVTDPKKAAATLNWVVIEMETRYKMLAACGVRNIHAFNSREEKPAGSAEDGNDKTPLKKMPYIIVVIDELADLMLVVQDKVEMAIGRLAQLSRAVGIHLILATQRPSVDVITGVIKANFPARLSFKVASKVDSRTVLDSNGADQLLGRGDMLFLQPGEPEPIRGQAPWVSDTEISKIVEFYKKKEKPQFIVAIEEAQSSLNSTSLNGEKDELYDTAVKLVLDSGIASVSHIQRRLRLGYGRAARLLDVMEAEGILGPPQGSKPREILRKIDAEV